MHSRSILKLTVERIAVFGPTHQMNSFRSGDANFRSFLLLFLFCAVENVSCKRFNEFSTSIGWDCVAVEKEIYRKRITHFSSFTMRLYGETRPQASEVNWIRADSRNVCRTVYRTRRKIPTVLTEREASDDE